jgi:tRNA A-37 threonylcarbamoyl transferase component Bud32
VNHPERLGKYQITEVLGEGAMGVVYKGFDPDIKRTVALKTIRRQFGDRAEGQMAAARFRNEAQAAGRLTHPGIVAVYDFGEDDSVAFIAMEFVEGHTLAHYLTSRVRFTDEDIPGVITQVLDALDHAHEQGVWHRDIKPANIIMAKNGKLKVADFGIARIEDAGLTQANVMIGTPTYMAPEQFLGGQMDRRVDIYGTGVLLYLLLTGRPPFMGSQEALMYKVVHEPPLPPSQLEGVNRPRFYDSIIERALAKDPKQRYATAAEFKAAIQRGVGEPFDTTVWERTLIGAADQLRAPPAPGAGSRSGAAAPTGSGSWSQAPTHWDQSVLQAAEASLARHVGPLAGVLVRRAARECADLPTLYAKLAEQVTNPQARNAFLEHATHVTTIKTQGGTVLGGSGTRATGTSAATAMGSSGNRGGPPLSDALLEAATRVLAQHVGPIAKVMVKKAAGRTTDHGQFYALLAEAAPEGAARNKLLAELQKLG